MAARRTGHIRSFTATDERGAPHTLHVFAPLGDAGRGESPDGEGPGAISIQTEGGQHVNHVKKGVYLTLSGETLRSGAPEAP
jgi:hypothetical protein